jgi:manganese transport protein
MGSSHHYQANRNRAHYCYYYFGEGVTGKLLIFSQVILSLQLGFAVIPLIHFVSDKTKMNGFHISKVTQVASWIVALIIVVLNGKLVYDEIKVG